MVAMSQLGIQYAMQVLPFLMPYHRRNEEILPIYLYAIEGRDYGLFLPFFDYFEFKFSK